MARVVVPVVRGARKLVAFIARRWLRRSVKRSLRRSTKRVEPDSAEGFPNPPYQARLSGWFHRLHFPHVAFYAELWRGPREEPSFPALAEKYGEDKAETEVAWLQTHLPREVATVAAGLLYTLERIEAILGELQAYVDEHVKPLAEGETWPERGFHVAHPLVLAASFEFANFLGWLRTIDERLDRPYLPRSSEREGLLPALADRPLRGRVQALVDEFRSTTLERTLANYQLHAGAVTQPLEGAVLSPDLLVRLPVPDRPNERVATRWHLSYEEEREALTVAREAAQVVESLVDGLIEAFEDETRAVEEERRQGRPT